VYSDGGQYDSLFLSNYLDVYVKDALKRVKGVGDAIVFGERKYAMRLWLDPSKMAQRGLTATNVLSALQEQTCKLQRAKSPAAVAGRPSLSDQRARGRAVERSFRIRQHYFEDRERRDAGAREGCGHAELGAENYGTLLRFNGHDAVGLAVTQLRARTRWMWTKPRRPSCCGSRKTFHRESKRRWLLIPRR